MSYSRRLALRIDQYASNPLIPGSAPRIWEGNDDRWLDVWCPVPAADKLFRDHMRRTVHFLVRLDKRLDMAEDLPVAAFERFEKGTGRPPEVAPRLA